MPLLAYIAVFSLFTCSFSLNLAALFIPKWLIHIIPSPEYIEKSYGLFKLCASLTGECRPFPRAENDDCKEGILSALVTKRKSQPYILCSYSYRQVQDRQAAGAGMIVAMIVGILTIVALLGVVCSNREQRERGWNLVTWMLVLYSIPSLASFSIIAYLYNTSSLFHSGTKYDESFIMNTVSWCISIILALSMLLASALMGNQQDYHYYYERID